MTPPTLTDDFAWLGAVTRALAPLRQVAAHDIRSPLNALRLNLTLVRRTLESGTAERWLAVAEQETGRLEAMLDSLTPLLGAIDERAPVADLTAILRTAEPLLRSCAQRRSLDWHLDVTPTPGRWPDGAEIALLASATLLVSHAEPQAGPVHFACQPGGPGLKVHVMAPESAATDKAAPVEAQWPPLLETIWRRADARLGAVTCRPNGLDIEVESRPLAQPEAQEEIP